MESIKVYSSVTVLIMCLTLFLNGSSNSIMGFSETEGFRINSSVEQTDYLELWLVQDPVAIVGEEVTMTYGVRNHYTGLTDVQLRLYDNELPIMPIFQEINTLGYLGVAEFNFTHTFSSVGSYPYLFEAEANGVDFYDELYYWNAYTDGTIYLTVQHIYDTVVGFENLMNFTATNYYSVTKNVSLEVDIDNGTHPIRIYDTYVFLDPYQEHIFAVSYTFSTSGLYTTIFNATANDTSNSWFEYGYWEVLAVIPELNLSLCIVIIVLPFVLVYIRKKSINL